MTDPKAKAQEIVDNYFNILFDDGDVNEIAICKHYAIACAISEVDGKIVDLKEMHDNIPDFKWFVRHRIEEQEAILRELKNMNQ